MAGKTKTRMNPLKIIGILIILILLTQFSKIKSFAGSFVGETADDGSMVYRGADEWAGEALDVTVGEGVKVKIPAKSEFLFDSEVITQDLDIGNPSGNALKMKAAMMMDESLIFETGILEPGSGFHEGPIKAIFEPNTYDAVMVYTFYEDGTGIRKKLKTIGTYELPVKVTAEGSGERYRENVARADKK